MLETVERHVCDHDHDHGLGEVPVEEVMDALAEMLGLRPRTSEDILATMTAEDRRNAGEGFVIQNVFPLSLQVIDSLDTELAHGFARGLLSMALSVYGSVVKGYIPPGKPVSGQLLPIIEEGLEHTFQKAVEFYANKAQ